MKSRFAKPCRELPTALDRHELRKAITYMGEKSSGDCHIELFFGFFFDGTRNNMYLSEKADDDSETNIARLWGIFDEEIDPAYSPRKHRFSSYIEGVGTRCMEKIGDPGVGVHAQAGASTAWGGEGRINWALLRFQENLFQHFRPETTLTREQGKDVVALVKKMSSDMAMSRFQVRQLAKTARMSVAQYGAVEPGSEQDVALRAATSALANLSAVGAEQLASPNDQQRIAVLRERRRLLVDSLKGFLPLYPKVSKIRLSIFGFSRGAAEARVFANWLADACDPPQPTLPPEYTDPRGEANGLRLCGIPVEVDFMGLFDTVTSVGAAQSMLPAAFDGHGGWGRQQDLAIPAYVRRCVHMVAAHEVRGSFPLDTIEGHGHEEIVYPGVHSDVGGGYKVGEQGRLGAAGDCKLSQIPLCDMYREAVAAGVPLRLDKFPAMQQKFAVSASLRQAFNAYVDATADISQAAKDTKALMHGHYGLYLRWRRLRMRRGAGWIGDTASARRALRSYPQDYEDLVSANDELLKEAQYMESADVLVRLPSPTGPHRELIVGVNVAEMMRRQLQHGKAQMWEDQIRAIWTMRQPLAPAIINLYDNYVHDSRAWFKPLADDDDVWFDKQRLRMRKLAAIERASQQPDSHPFTVSRVPPLSDQEKEELARWRANPDDLPLQSGGREFYWWWGYLRWRTLYTHPLGQALASRREEVVDRVGRPPEYSGVPSAPNGTVPVLW